MWTLPPGTVGATASEGRVLTMAVTTTTAVKTAPKPAVTPAAAAAAAKPPVKTTAAANASGAAKGAATLAKPATHAITIQKGDTLGQIAVNNHTTVQALQAANKTTITDPNLIIAGAKLNIPDAVAGAAAVKPVTPKIVPAPLTVAKTQAATTQPAAKPAAAKPAAVTTQPDVTADLAALNKQVLALQAKLGAQALTPAATPPKATPPAPQPATAPAAAHAITIQPGDTLSEIALRSNTTVAALVAENKDTVTNANLIRAGAKLRIPAAKAAPKPVVAAPKPAAATPAAPKPAPAASPATTTPAPITGQPLGGPNGLQIVRAERVLPGDTLATIAQRTGTTVENLININRNTVLNGDIARLLTTIDVPAVR